MLPKIFSQVWLRKKQGFKSCSYQRSKVPLSLCFFFAIFPQYRIVLLLQVHMLLKLRVVQIHSTQEEQQLLNFPFKALWFANSR